MKRNLVGCAVGLFAVGLVVGGCGGSSTGGSPASPGKGSAAASPSEKVLTGKRLNSMLLSKAVLPAGFKLDADGTGNTGAEVAPASKAPVPARKLCGMLGETSWIRVAGIGSATFAENDYVDAGQENEVAQEIDDFHAGEGPRVITGIRHAFAKCRTYVDKSDGATAHIKLTAAKLPTGNGVKAVLTTPVFAGGTTLVAVREGDVVVTTLYSSSHKDKGAKAVAYAEAIAKKVQAAG